MYKSKVDEVLIDSSINYQLDIINIINTINEALINCDYGYSDSIPLIIKFSSISIDLVKSFVDYKLEYNINNIFF